MHMKIVVRQFGAADRQRMGENGGSERFGDDGIAFDSSEESPSLPAPLGEYGVQVESLDELPPAPHANFPEDIGEMILDRVLGDEEGLRDLPGRRPADGQVDHVVLSCA